MSKPKKFTRHIMITPAGPVLSTTASEAAMLITFGRARYVDQLGARVFLIKESDNG